MSERGSISGRSQGDEAPCAQSMQRQSPEKRTVEAGSGAAEHAGDIIQHRVRVALLLHEESAVWISERRLNTGCSRQLTAVASSTSLKLEGTSSLGG